MKIGTRLFLSLALPLIAIVLLFGYLNRQRSRALLQEELTREGRAIARVAQMAMEDYVRDGQIEDARELVQKLTGYERVMGLRLFDRQGALLLQSVGLESNPLIDAELLGKVLRTREPAEARATLDGQPIVCFILPLANSQGDPLGAVQVLQLESFITETDRASQVYAEALTAAMVAATAIIIFLVARYSVGRPVEELVRRLRLAGSGDLAARVPEIRRDEFGRLAQEFNIMCERLEASQRSLIAEQEERRRAESRLRNAERLASIGRLAAGLAHEIGTPLNVIGGRAETLLRKLSGNEIAEKGLRIIASQIDRIARTVRGMLDFARLREPRLTPTDVGAVIRKVLDLLEQRMEEGGVRVRPELPAGLPAVVADADQLHQVFLNLATNALDAMPRGGTLAISARHGARPPADKGEAERSYLAIAFRDTGTGIAPENLIHVFDPFFSTKDVGKGTGLGLSISYGIVREHGGFIDVESEAGRGACVSVYLPLTEARPAAAAGAAAARS